MLKRWGESDRGAGNSDFAGKWGIYDYVGECIVDIDDRSRRGVDIKNFSERYKLNASLDMSRLLSQNKQKQCLVYEICFS